MMPVRAVWTALAPSTRPTGCSARTIWAFTRSTVGGLGATGDRGLARLLQLAELPFSYGTSADDEQAHEIQGHDPFVAFTEVFPHRPQ